MAVKYSKTRDFGAKGRKSRKLGKKMFTKKSVHKLKSSAKRKAAAWRKKGYSARVVKMTRGYGVYTHTK
jgi:hypothetical protein